MGKSSLLDALTLLLSPEFDLYHFIRDDFWFPRATSRARTPFAYYPDLTRNGAGAAIGSGVSVRFSAAGCLAMTGITGCSIASEGELAEDDSVMTLRSFIDGEGEALVLEEIDELARHRCV